MRKNIEEAEKKINSALRYIGKAKNECESTIVFDLEHIASGIRAEKRALLRIKKELGYV